MTKDDPISGGLMGKFFDPVVNAPDDDALRAWLRQQPAREIERFLKHFGDWASFPDRQTIVSQELRRKHHVERFEKCGPDIIRADLDRGGHQFLGGSPEVRELALEWLAEKEGRSPEATETPSQSPWLLNLPKLWRSIRKWWPWN